MRIGIHTSIAASLENAALKASGLGANTFQIFSSSPRMWRASSLGAEQIRLLRRARERLDLYPLAIHVNYLVNLASVDPVIRARSIASLRGELERAADIGAEYLVLHPGSYKGQSLEAGIAAFVQGLHDVAAGVRTGVTVLLENTVGCGAQIGGRFEELRAIRDSAANLTNVPVGYCLDTCHLLAAGYEVASEAGLRETVRQAERALGIDNVKLIHANDSKTPLGSHIDRHANIGEGYIGKAGFRRILAHPRLRAKPFILETPVEQDGDDRRNLENLKKLCPKSRTTTTKSS
ncbi:MAG TPA: deoxyribonuclease IV [Bryobacteraceae bacterium]|nr:deoxyribonuclease IV [Bryobacteraceae bacterium]